MTTAGPHVFWITSRAAGTAALLLAGTSVGVGLISSRRGGGRLLPATDLRALHEALSLATLAAVAVHGLALLGDHYLHPTLAQISIPFASAYRPLWTGLGVVAGWGLAMLGLSYYARSRIGTARWRLLHRFTAVFWLLAIGHALGAGSDASQPWFLIGLALPSVPALLLLSARLLAPRSSPPPRRRPTLGGADAEVLEVGAQP